MRIAVDARAATEVAAGRGRVVRELLRSLARLDHDHEFALLAREQWNCEELDDRFRWRLLGWTDPFWALRAAPAAGDADVLLATNSYLLAAAAPVPALAIVYDLVPFDRELRPPRGSVAERLTLPIAVRRANGFLCISEATRQALISRFPRAEARAHTVPLGVESLFAAATPDGVPNRYGLARPFVLVTGTLEPRKNLPRVIDAFLRLPEELRQQYELVLAGGRGWGTAELDARVREHAANVRTLGYVPDYDLAALYAAATVFCYASLEEGFGLPVAEAMAAGAPVVTSNVSSLPEVGGDAVRYVDPRDVQSIADGMRELLESAELRQELSERGRKRAAQFTWERTARETLALLERAAV